MIVMIFENLYFTR